MKRRQNRTSLLWLIQAEDSGMADERTDLFLAMDNHKKLIMAAVKFILWYGTAISFGLLIATLH